MKTPEPFQFIVRRQRWASQVINVLCEAHGVTRQALKSTSRVEELVWLRFIAMVIIRENSSLSLNQIGSMFGNRHHKGILHAIVRVRDRCDAYPEFALEMKAWREHFAAGRPASMPAKVRLVA